MIADGTVILDSAGIAVASVAFGMLTVDRPDGTATANPYQQFETWLYLQGHWDAFFAEDSDPMEFIDAWRQDMDGAAWTLEMDL
jgi:hypothetical protein